jgi:hypothetical protein
MEKEFYKCPKSGNPKARNPTYKNREKIKDEPASNIGKSGYENDDITGHWGPSLEGKW